MLARDGSAQSQRVLALQDMLLRAPRRTWRTKEIADRRDVSVDTAFRVSHQAKRVWSGSADLDGRDG